MSDTAKKCANGCGRDAHPADWRGMCLECNPRGDSEVMNNDPSYQAWLDRNNHLD